MQSPSPNTDVLMVGAGPTGLALALALTARGRSISIIDSQPGGQNTSRASVVYSRTLEVLEPYGVAQRLVAEGIRARRFTIRDHDQVLMVVPFDRLPTAFPFTLLVSQAVTESILVQRLGELGIRVQRPCELKSLQQDGGGVTARFASGQEMRARYLVGADGMHSTVREQVGIGFKTSGSGSSYSLADVHLSGGLPKDEVAVYFSPEGQLVSVPFVDGTFKIVTSIDEAPKAPDMEFVQQQIDARGPQTDRPVVHDIVWGSRFRIHHAVAECYRLGRIALAGDAAHDNSPLGGQGMNTGIGDAVALAGALDTALQSDSPDALEAYARVRRPVAKQVVMMTNMLTRLALMDRQLRTLRNVTLRGISPFVSRRFAWQLSGLVYR
jgi:2-polyprenyl-6-methoxyphenol hydroxylase-like FAD-dependent oxidoreductase